MRRAVVLTVILGLGIVGWVILDADPDGRAELWEEVTGWFGGDQEAAPNWGDVAVKVGEFTDEERALREALNPVGGAEDAVPPAP